MRKLTPLTLSLLLLLSFPLLATTIRVPQDQPTIQAGINAASNHDTVLVAPGVFVENINFGGKSIVLKSLTGPASTVIRPNDPQTPIIQIVSGEDSFTTVDGFSIRKGKGIVFHDSKGLVVNNVFDSTRGVNGGAVSCIGSASIVRIRNNVFQNGLQVTQGAAFYSSRATVEFSRNLVTNNYGNAVLFSDDNSTVSILNNTIGNSVDGNIMASYYSTTEVRNNIFFNFLRPDGFAVNGGSVTFNYNNFFNVGMGLGGTGNIFSNPLFIGGNPYDYSLQNISPCIDAGDPATPPPPGGGARVDMGAFEFPQRLPLVTPRGIVLLRKPQFIWSRFKDSTGIVSVSYRVVLAVDCDFTSADTSPVLTDTIWKTSYALNTDHNYCWKVIAVPDSGDSLITDLAFFRVIKPPIMQVLPVNNAVFKDRRPTFIWKTVSDTSIPELFVYRVVLSTDSTFSMPETSSTLSDTVWKADRNLVVGQTYYWKVLAVGDSGDTVVSGVAKFSVTGSIAQYLPANNSSLKLRRPTFSWQNVQDTSIPGPFTYQVLLSTDVSFSQMDISPPLSDTIWKVDHILNDNQVYFWKVIAIANTGDTVFSNITSFRILFVLSNLHVPVSSIRIKQPTFIWQTVRDTSVLDSFVYRTILSKSVGFELAETSVFVADTMWKVPHKLDLSSTYYWKVQGFSDSGGSISSNPRSFTVLPPLLNPLLPLENANMRERQPTLIWSSVRDSSIPDTFSYVVQVAKDGNFNSAIVSPVLFDTTWQIVGTLQVGGIYFWKVMAFYSADEDTVQPSSIIFFREQPSRIIIPDDRGKIQEGIDIALNGDTVWVKPGIYYENVFFKGKRVKLISEGGPEVTSIAKYVDGLQLINFSSSEDTTTLVSGFTITGANSVSGGGAIRIANASPRIENNHIVGNSGDAGSIWVENGFPVIQRNLIAKDTGEAAIVFSGNSGGAVINCTIADNFGHGIQVEAAIPIQIVNSIIAFNTRYGIRSANGTNLGSTIAYNDVFGNGSGHFFAILPSTGNLHADPLFFGGSPFNYRLSSTSPCIDSGDPGFPVPPGGGPRIDMGTFEFIVTRGDLNGDGIFTAADIILELNCVFLSTGNCNLTIADLNCDSQLSPTDVVLVLSFVFLGSPFPC